LPTAAGRRESAAAAAGPAALSRPAPAPGPGALASRRRLVVLARSPAVYSGHGQMRRRPGAARRPCLASSAISTARRAGPFTPRRGHRARHRSQQPMQPPTHGCQSRAFPPNWANYDYVHASGAARGGGKLPPYGWKSKNYVTCVCFHCHGTSSYHTTNTLQGRRAKSHVDTQTIGDFVL